MKTGTVIMLLIGIMLMAVPAFAQDFGTEIPLTFPGETKRLWKTDWSPDGKWIAFGKTMYDGDYHNNIWIVSTTDGTKKNLTGEIEGDCNIPIFTPYGDEVIFSRWVKNETKQIQSSLESVNIYTGEHNVVLNEAFAGSMSRDGKYLAYVYWPDPDDRENMTNALYNIEDDETVYYDFWNNEPLFDFGHSQMSPDNSHFVTTLVKESGQNILDNPHALYSVSLDGSIIEEITSDGDPWYPKYSPDGKWILFTRFDYTDKDVDRNMPSRKVQLYNTETGEITDLLTDNSYSSLCGSWSPDGSKICYILDDNGDYSLYIKDFQDAADEIQVSVEDESPSGFALHGNYPNPFNPSTTIEFSLPEAGFADLVIYNLSGQKVRELVSGSMSEGIHTAVWNGRDDRGLPVSAGVYMSQLTMGDAVTTGRMMLLK